MVREAWLECVLPPVQTDTPAAGGGRDLRDAATWLKLALRLTGFQHRPRERRRDTVNPVLSAFLSSPQLSLDSDCLCNTVRSATAGM